MQKDNINNRESNKVCTLALLMSRGSACKRVWSPCSWCQSPRWWRRWTLDPHHCQWQHRARMGCDKILNKQIDRLELCWGCLAWLTWRPRPPWCCRCPRGSSPGPGHRTCPDHTAHCWCQCRPSPRGCWHSPVCTQSHRCPRHWCSQSPPTRWCWWGEAQTTRNIQQSPIAKIHMSKNIYLEDFWPGLTSRQTSRCCSSRSPASRRRCTSGWPGGWRSSRRSCCPPASSWSWTRCPRSRWGTAGSPRAQCRGCHMRAAWSGSSSSSRRKPKIILVKNIKKIAVAINKVKISYKSFVSFL